MTATDEPITPSSIRLAARGIYVRARPGSFSTRSRGEATETKRCRTITTEMEKSTSPYGETRRASGTSSSRLPALKDRSFLATRVIFPFRRSIGGKLQMGTVKCVHSDHHRQKLLKLMVSILSSAIRIMKIDRRRSSYLTASTFLAVGIYLMLLASFAQLTPAQMKNTEHKANKNLKGAARINPSTLAMEFSIPLANYPGRAGNAIPVTLSYSSKVWHRKSYSPITRERYTQSDLPPWDIVTTYNSIAHFGRRSVSGWTSSMQSPAIINELEIYNQSGQLHSFSPEPVDEFQCNGVLPGEIRQCHSGSSKISTA